MVNTVREFADEGVPESYLFLALESKLGFTIGAFLNLSDALVLSGYCRRENNKLYYVRKEKMS